jgi:tetratricopeptide (TPR) repeat protein
MTDSKLHPVTFLRTLMEARDASARGDWNASVHLWELVVANNPTQADFWLALGDAQFQVRDYPSAIAAYYEALDLGAGFPFDTAYQIARCHAHDEQFDEAINWLERAFELGYRNLKLAQTDEVFTPLHDDQRFRDLVGLIDVAELSRDEDWRFDLTFFSREIKRKAFHPWRLVSESDFDAAVAQLHEDIPELNEYEILIELRRILALLGDGHASASFADGHPLAPATLPLQFYLFEEGLFIIASTLEHADLLGSQVLQFGGNGIAEMIDVFTPTIPRDSDSWIKLKIPYLIRELPIVHALGLIPDPKQVELTLKDVDGRERVVTISAGNHLSTDELYYSFPYPAGWEFFPNTLDTSLPSYIRNQAAYYWFEYLQDQQTVYFQFNRVRDSASESFGAFTERLFSFIDEHPVRKLVIDLRCNNGGNTFLEMPFLHRLIGNRINQRGSLFVITGRRTFSAAQNFSSLIERHTEATFVGEPTGASPNFFGETIPVELPYSKLMLNVSDLYWQSSWPTDNRTWIAPLIYLPPTFAAYRENRDPVLDAILEWGDHLPGQ